MVVEKLCEWTESIAEEAMIPTLNSIISSASKGKVLFGLNLLRSQSIHMRPSHGIPSDHPLSMHNLCEETKN